MTELNNDLEISTGTDYNMDEVDDMPQYINQIDGVYACSLGLTRETGEKNGKEQDNLVFTFVIDEIIEEKKDHGINVEDIVAIRYSLVRSSRDIEDRKKESFGLRLAKPALLAIREALQCGGSLNEIIKEAQDVKCTVTFSTRESKGQDKEGNTVVYHNPQIKKLIVG